MAFALFVLLVLGTSAASYVRRERSHRRRWQLIELPPVEAGAGAYRASQVSGATLAEAPAPLRFAVFTCIAYGRAVTFSLLATALHLAGVRTGALAVPALHAMLGYFTAGAGVGAVAALVLAASVMRAGGDLMVRDPRRAFARTRGTALASLALHGFVLANALTGAWMVGLGSGDARRSMGTTAVVAGVAMLHALVLLAITYAYRGELSARSAGARAWDA